MGKIKGKIKKYKKIELIALSFLIPIIVYTTILYINGMLTDKTLLSGDMFVQYYPLYNYLKEVFNGTTSIFYSFTKSLGGTMFGTIFYYLSSPLNLLLIIVDKQNIPQFMTGLIILKLSLCGLTMYLYMRKKFKTDNIVLLAFSLCYSFMGYNLNYFINIMWLDVIFMTPIVLIGLEKIIENKSPKLYIITLVISIFSNYYMAYMLCMLCAMYFIYEMLLKYDIKKDAQIIKQITKKFIISSLLSGLMCSFFLIPCIFEMTNYGRGVTLKNVFTFDYNFFNLFSKSYIGSLNLKNTLNSVSMNIYCGTITLPLIYLFLVNNNINKKERKLTFIFILIMILPCFIKILTYFWHLFTIATFYNYRYSFLLCLLLIRIAYKSLTNLKITKKEALTYLSIYMIISLYFVIITYYSEYYDFLNYKLIWITLLFLITYIILLLNKNKKKIIYIISILLLLENFTNIYIIFKNNDFFIRYDEIETTQPKYEEIINKYSEIGNRIEKREILTMNDSILMNYNGISTFLSTNNSRILDVFAKYGFNETETYFKNMFAYDKDNYMLESILGMKYIINNTKMENYKLIETIEINDKEFYVYENPNSIGYGTIVKNQCNNITNEAIYSEEIYNCLFGTDYKLFKEYKSKNGVYNIDTKYYYVFSKDIINSNFIKLNPELKENVYFESYDYTMFEKSTDKIKLNIDETIDQENLKVMYFDYKLFKSKKYTNLNIEAKEKNYLKGNVDSKEDGILMITLPYEKGFEIYIDGKKTDYFEVANMFLGINIEKGYHDIELKYHQPKLREGIFISACSFITCVIYIHLERKKNNEKISH